MINHETELKLQAYLDGELSSGEAKAVEDLSTHDADARALFEELKLTKSVLAENELEVRLPESRGFYWSKIQRQIEREEKGRVTEQTETAASSWWLRFLAPAGALAVLVVLVVVALRAPKGAETLVALDGSHEIETPLEETSSFSFQSEAAGMTVVWVDSHRE